jgi:hypothetical protein
MNYKLTQNLIQNNICSLLSRRKLKAETVEEKSALKIHITVRNTLPCELLIDWFIESFANNGK